MLKSMLLKDIRLLSSYLVLSAILVLLAYALGFTSLQLMPVESMPHLASPSARAATVLSAGCLVGLWLSIFGCAMLGGNAFAAERMDRSALFLDYLPPTRQQVLISKLTVVIGFMLLHFLVSLGSARLASSLTTGVSMPRGTVVEISTVIHVCKIVTCVTGISFAVSTIAKSTGPPILLGLFAPLIVFGLVKSVDFLLDLPLQGETIFPRVASACLVFGAGGILTGCWWYIRQRYEY